VQVLKAAGFMHDMLLLAAVLLYLISLGVVLVLATRGWADLQAMWSPKPAARRRNTKSSSKNS
jgi:cobalamin biosynthesis protein CobD/CbiB